MLTVSTEKVLSSARPPEVVLREKEAEFFVFVFCVTNAVPVKMVAFRHAVLVKMVAFRPHF